YIISNDENVQKDMKMLPYKVIPKDGSPYVDVEFQGQHKIFSPEQVSAMILQKMKEVAEVSANIIDVCLCRRPTSVNLFVALLLPSLPISTMPSVRLLRMPVRLPV